MGKVCATCGTDNRERAMFCRGCSGSLQHTPPPDRPILTGTVRDEERPAIPFKASPKGTASTSITAVAMLLLVGAAAVWFSMREDKPPQPTDSPTPTASSTSVSAETPLPAADSALPENEALTAAPPARVAPSELASAEDRVNAMIARNARLKQDRLEREKRSRLEASREQARAAQELERQRADEANKLANRPPAQPVERVPSPAQPQALALTVTRICDGAGNFFSRELCRVRECSKASQDNDPVCVKIRAMEEAQRTREQYL